MAKERAFNYRNTGTKENPVWEKWYSRTVVDAVLMSDADNETKTLADALQGKVDKVVGKQLSTEDYTSSEKDKLAGLSKTTVDSVLSASSMNPLQNKVVKAALDGKVPTGRKVNSKPLASDITLSAADVGAIAVTQKGAVSGVAELDSTGKVPSNQLPSYVDDVVEGWLFEGKFYSDEAHTRKITDESGKIYGNLHENGKSYRWTGTVYTAIPNGVAIGETSNTAGRGDWTKKAYDHSQTAHAPVSAEQNVQSDWVITDVQSDAFIKNKPTSLPANGGNAGTVNGHTVESNVPANAKFTDTTYAVFKAATVSAAGGAGLVPAPAAGAQTKYLCADGSWKTPSNTTYAPATTDKDGLMSKADKSKLDNLPGIYIASELPTSAPVGSVCFLI